MASKHHILVLGATGPSGILFCNAALAAGHKLTIYARSPSKLPDSIKNHEKVGIIEGTFNDKAGLEKAAECGADVMVSVAGPAIGNTGTPVTDCYKILIPLLISNGCTRVLVMSTPSFSPPEDKWTIKWRLSRIFIQVIGGSAFREIVGLSELVRSYPTSQLQWTLFRLPWLLNGEAKSVKPAFAGSGSDGFTLTRESLAQWLVGELENGEWVGQSPILSN